MVHFFADLEKRKAFKQALKEIEEDKTDGALHTSNAAVTRVYINPSETPSDAGGYVNVRPVSPLRRPETSAVDLKNFKDWRNATAKPATPPTQPEPATKPTTPKLTTAQILEKYSIKPATSDRTIGTDSTEYLRNRIATLSNNVAKTEPKPAVKEPVKPQPEPKVDTVKIEVINSAPAAPTPKPAAKPAVKRKPRGKSRRRFDADVISNVDWK